MHPFPSHPLTTFAPVPVHRVLVSAADHDTDIDIDTESGSHTQARSSSLRSHFPMPPTPPCLPLLSNRQQLWNSCGRAQTFLHSPCVRWMIFSVACLTVVAFISLLMAGWASVSQQGSGCGRTDEPIVYWEIPIVQNSTTSTAFPSSYHLYRLNPMNEGVDEHRNESVSVSEHALLFVHGHRGSYEQAEPLATQIIQHQRAKLETEVNQPVRVTVYAVDFGPDLGSHSAFSVKVLRLQAHFVNAALRTIQTLHSHSNCTSENPVTGAPVPPPSRIQTVGLSFGGVVLREAVLLHDHPRSDPTSMASSISMLLTLQTPHRAHPAIAQPQMHSFYSDLNHRWAAAFGNTPSPSSADSQLLAKLALVSVTGGARDKLVRSDLSLLDGIPSSNALSLYTSSMDGVLQMIEHDEMAWCQQLLSSLTRMVLDVANKEQQQMQLNVSMYINHMPLIRQLQSLTPWKLELDVASMPGGGVDREALSLPSQFMPSTSQLSSTRLSASTSTLPISLSPSPSSSSASTSPSNPLPSCAAVGGEGQHLQFHHHSLDADVPGLYSLHIGNSARDDVHVVPFPSAPHQPAKMILVSNIPSRSMHVCIRSNGTQFTSTVIPHSSFIDLPVSGSIFFRNDTMKQPTTLLLLHTNEWMITHEMQMQNEQYQPELHIQIDSPPRSSSSKLNRTRIHSSPSSSSYWVLIQFLPTDDFVPSESTQVEWPDTIQMTMRDRMLVPLPKWGVHTPHSMKVDIVSRHKTEDNPDLVQETFQPMAYTLYEPSMEAFWQSSQRSPNPHPASEHRNVNDVRTQHIIPGTWNHASSTTPQQHHLVLLVDPRFEHAVIRSPDWIPTLFQQVRMWYEIIVESFVGWCWIGCIVQIWMMKSRKDGHSQWENQHHRDTENGPDGYATKTVAIPPLHVILLDHWIVSIFAMYLFVCSFYLQPLQWLFENDDVFERNTPGFLPSFRVAFVLAWIGWSALLVLSMAFHWMWRGISFCVGPVARRCRFTYHGRDGGTLHSPSSFRSHHPNPNSRLIMMLSVAAWCALAVLLTLAPLPFLTACTLICFIHSLIFIPSSHPAAWSYILCLFSTLVLRAPSLLQQSLVLYSWRMDLFDVNGADMVSCGICVAALVLLLSSDTNAFDVDGQGQAHKTTGRAERNNIVRQQLGWSHIISFWCLIAASILTARAHLFYALPMTALISLSIVTPHLHSIGAHTFLRLRSFLRSHSSGISRLFPRLQRTSSSAEPPSMSMVGGDDDEGDNEAAAAAEMDALLQMERGDSAMSHEEATERQRTPPTRAHAMHSHLP